MRIWKTQDDQDLSSDSTIRRTQEDDEKHQKIESSKWGSIRS
jgi:hypothetical protein